MSIGVRDEVERSDNVILSLRRIRDSDADHEKLDRSFGRSSLRMTLNYYREAFSLGQPVSMSANGVEPTSAGMSDRAVAAHRGLAALERQ